MQRFWDKVDMTGECWEWTAYRDAKGYGKFKLGGDTLAHRVAYELMVGAIADGMTIDHLCRNRACVKPEHLEQVTLQENIKRGTRAQSLRTECIHGHPFDDANTYITPDGRRNCRTCRAAASARAKARS